MTLYDSLRTLQRGNKPGFVCGSSAISHGLRAAWAEFDWSGGEIEMGGARLRVIGRIERCTATNVDPETAARDMNIPLALQRGFGHVDMGIYAKVLTAGEITAGDRIIVPDP